MKTERRSVWLVLVLVLTALVLAGCATTPAATSTAFYAIDRGTADRSSTLYYFDEFGEVSVIGDTGHALVAIKFDPTTGVLYGATREQDTNDACNSCLVTIDTSTGAVTVIGPFDVDADTNTVDGPVPSLAFTSDGTLYGWTEQDDDAIEIDKATGAYSVLGDSGVGSYGHGMFADGADTLWFVNGDGYIYTISPTDGSATEVHVGEDVAADSGLAYSGDLMVRGDLNPDNGEYWGVASGYGGVPFSGVARMTIDAATAEIVGSATVDTIANIHNLAFPR